MPGRLFASFSSIAPLRDCASDSRRRWQARKDRGIHVAAFGLQHRDQVSLRHHQRGEFAAQVPVDVVQQLPDAIVGGFAMLGVRSGEQHLQVIVVGVARRRWRGQLCDACSQGKFAAQCLLHRLQHRVHIGKAARFTFGCAPADGEQRGEHTGIVAQPEHMDRLVLAEQGEFAHLAAVRQRGGLANQRCEGGRNVVLAGPAHLAIGFKDGQACRARQQRSHQLSVGMEIPLNSRILRHRGEHDLPTVGGR